MKFLHPKNRRPKVGADSRKKPETQNARTPRKLKIRQAREDPLPGSRTQTDPRRTQTFSRRENWTGRGSGSRWGTQSPAGGSPSGRWGVRW